MSYYERTGEYFSGLDTSDLIGCGGSDPRLIGEAFISEIDTLNNLAPGFSEPFFIALTSKVVGKLGLGLVFKGSFDLEEGITDDEIEFLINEKFDRKLAATLVYLALYRHELLKLDIDGKKEKRLERCLNFAEKNLNDSFASEGLKFKPEMLLTVLKNQK